MSKSAQVVYKWLLDENTANMESLHNWLVRLGKDLRSHILWHVELKTALIDTIRTYNFLSWNPATLWHPHPYRSDYLVK